MGAHVATVPKTGPDVPDPVSGSRVVGGATSLTKENTDRPPIHSSPQFEIERFVNERSRRPFRNSAEPRQNILRHDQHSTTTY